jgi:hypothetical protein
MKTVQSEPLAIARPSDQDSLDTGAFVQSDLAQHGQLLHIRIGHVPCKALEQRLRLA